MRERLRKRSVGRAARHKYLRATRCHNYICTETEFGSSPTAVSTLYPVDFGGLWWTSRPSVLSGPDSTLADLAGRSSLSKAFQKVSARRASDPTESECSNSCSNPGRSSG